MTQSLTYDVVMATRNRVEAVALSLPLLIAQTRPPEQIIVVDSSTDPAPMKALVESVAADSAIPIHYHPSDAGLPHQRNVGLGHVTADVVLYPDDDSLLFSDTMAKVMEVYERDTEKRIKGVGAADSQIAPPDSIPTAGSYQRRRGDVLRARIGRQRYALEERFIPDPFHLVAQTMRQDLPDAPAWIGNEIYPIVSWITGYRMSFRTDAIRDIQFDPALGRYALFEDTDACFGVLRAGYLVGVQDAKIYHHKAPARRSNGRALGGMQILNRAYVCSKTGKVDRSTRSALKRFSYYKVAQYAASASSEFGRDRFNAARAALAEIDPLLDASGDELRARYLDARQRVFAGDD